ncbi:HBS1 eRFS Gtpase [Cryptosporidium ryanae]|uniref:HBS1 eRFS Gtpase n=1 Tax=Cryptosporidium ryanae TaxID=515981 RepID=UPI00351A03C3|nr:HBS1 eRFS Gtpase [Cryptosporidium ryanae]
MVKHRSKHIDLTDDDYYDGYDSEDDYNYYDECEFRDDIDKESVDLGKRKALTNTKQNNINSGIKGAHVANKNNQIISKKKELITKSKGKKSDLEDVTVIDKSKENEMVEKVSDSYNHICVILGHVDSGKSTLMGHLFVSLGYVEENLIRKYFKESESIGKSSFAYAWVFDDCEDERERGVTINVTAKYIKLNNINEDNNNNNSFITILDSPGHVEFIPSSFFATLTSDSAIIVIDVSNFESGFIKGQTKEHILFALFSNVSNIIFALNKMDNIEWDQNIYNDIASNIKEYVNNELSEIDSGNTNLLFIPVCAFKGVNVYEKKSEYINTVTNNWYRGPTLFELLSGLSSVDFNGKSKIIKNKICNCLGNKNVNNHKNELSAYIFEILSVNYNEFKASIYLEYGTLKTGNQYTLLPNQTNIKCKSILIDKKYHTSFSGSVFISSVTFTCNIHPSVGNVIISNNIISHSNHLNNKSIGLYYPMFITKRIKIKLIKKLNKDYFIKNNIIWNVPGKSFMLYFHCNSIPAILNLVKNNIYFFEADYDFVSYLRCLCHDSSNMGKAIIRFFGVTAFIGETIL